MRAPLSKVETIIARSPAAHITGRHKKAADAQLYRVLVDCMEIVEVCLRHKDEFEVLNRLIKELPLLPGKTKMYVVASSDVYQRVCRFMFHGEEHNANTNRYAHCLREAARLGIKSKNLMQELQRGGVNRFFLTRPGQSANPIVETKCIRLSRVIAHKRHDTFTLTLRRGPENVYEVIKQEK
jgi:hypothetical protein